MTKNSSKIKKKNYWPKSLIWSPGSKARKIQILQKQLRKNACWKNLTLRVQHIEPSILYIKVGNNYVTMILRPPHIWWGWHKGEESSWKLKKKKSFGYLSVLGLDRFFQKKSKIFWWCMLASPSLQVLYFKLKQLNFVKEKKCIDIFGHF